MLPNFFILGAQKAGTTALHTYLSGHPEVFLPAWKEPDFFIEARTWQRGLGWYEELFAGAGDAPARGEASTSYTMFPFFTGVPDRLFGVVRKPRLIYLMREPIARMRSAYQHGLARGVERRPIEDALLHEARYLIPSCYAFQLEQWLPRVPRDRVLLLTAEALRHDRAATLRRVLEFLGVDPAWRPADLDQEHHVSDIKRAPRASWQSYRTVAARVPGAVPGRLRSAEARGSRLLTRPIEPGEVVVSDDLRERLAALLRPDLVRLRGYLGTDFDCWGLA
ncbi:MAG: sulfotransferase domain-containing protein [Frankiales bacterium]|nr:sulfotransferase domain-containing protein [Frankiales bacterium]